MANYMNQHDQGTVQFAYYFKDIIEIVLCFRQVFLTPLFTIAETVTMNIDIIDLYTVENLLLKLTMLKLFIFWNTVMFTVEYKCISAFYVYTPNVHIHDIGDSSTYKQSIPLQNLTVLYSCVL